VRLSGEIADRSVLDALRATWPEAAIVHAYASTEAGVAFEVSDGKEGFPASYLNGGVAGIDLKIEAGTLRIRSTRTAAHYVGAAAPVLLDTDRFVDTDDVVEQVGDRCFFRGRRSGVINIGGNKVHPEEVERVINLHPAVSMSRVKSRRNPILGDLIVADVVLKPDHTTDENSMLRDQILATCRRELARHKVPVTLAFPASLPLIGSGKMGRQHA
jgi:acyl-CoA synthetase (AMP-forming)/AMP-acid ligase II